jgi:hypothetical protein
VVERHGLVRQRRRFDSQRRADPNARKLHFFLPSPIGQKAGLCSGWVGILVWRSTMKKFLALYMANASEMADMMKKSTPEQQKKGMEAWMKWMDHNKALFVDRGAPVGKTKRVDSKGTKDTKNDVCGYSIVQAESADQAAKMFGKDSPHFQMPGASVEVIEVLEMPAM